jgi:hypothetical protein
MKKAKISRLIAFVVVLPALAVRDFLERMAGLSFRNCNANGMARGTLIT